MLRVLFLAAAAGLGLILVGGCRLDNSPPPQPVPVPANDSRDARMQRDPVKPMPANDPLLYTGNFHTSPTQTPTPAPAPAVAPAPAPRPSEQTAMSTTQTYVAEYARVGRPKIALFVSHAPGGVLLPANGEVPPAAPKDLREADRLPDSFYQTIESTMVEWLSADAQVNIVPPTTVRSSLTSAQSVDLEKGLPAVLTNVSQFADILIQVQPTPSTKDSHLKLTGEALNTRGGELLGRETIDVSVPADRAELSSASRDLAVLLARDMSGKWLAYPTAPPRAATTAPTTAP